MSVHRPENAGEHLARVRPLGGDALTSVEASPDGNPGYASLLLRSAMPYSIILVLIVMAIAGGIASPGFLQQQSVITMLVAVAPMGIIAVGMTFVLIAGGVDVSVGAVFAAAGVAYTAVANTTGSLLVAFAAALALGALAGLVNGILIAQLKLNPFIVTLGTAAIFIGVLNVATDSTAVYASHPDFSELAVGEALGIPFPIWVLVIVLVAGLVALGHTTYGRAVYAVGDSAEACRLMGVRIIMVQISTYVLVGSCAAVGGVLFASQSGVGLSTVGGDIALLSIAAVVVGGTSLFGGRGAMWRTAVGVAIFAMINSLFIAMALNAAIQSVVLGSVIVIALIMDRLQNTRR